MGRIDFGKDNFDEFKAYLKPYFRSGKMKLLVVKDKGIAILRSRTATRYDSACILGLSEAQIDELQKFVGDAIETWHPVRFLWDEEIKEKVEG